MAFSDRMKKAAELAKAGVDKAAEIRASHEAAMERARANARPPNIPAAAEAAGETSWILTLKSHDEGKNANVTLFADRIERVLERSMVSLSRARQEAEVIPIAAISSVATRKDGMLYTVVSAITSGAEIDFRLRHDEAAAFKDALTKLVLAYHAAAPAAGDMASQLAQLNQLHESGALDDAEFAAAKAKLLA